MITSLAHSNVTYPRVCAGLKPMLQQGTLYPHNFYCPQMKFGARKCFYTCLSFFSQGGGGLPNPLDAEPLPLDATPPGCRPPVPWMQTPPIWSTSGWYASYWNAYLSCISMGFITGFSLNSVYLKLVVASLF